MTTPLRDRLKLTVWSCICLLGLAGMSQLAIAAYVDALALQYFPQATHIGEFEGEPLAAAVYRDEEVLGYLMRTTDIAPIPAYSGEPITLLVGIDLDGADYRSQDHRTLRTHSGRGRLRSGPRALCRAVPRGNGGPKVKLGGAEREGYVTIDGITGATITAMVMNATVMKAVKKVAESRVVSRSSPRSLERPPAMMGGIHRQPDRSMRPWRNHHRPGGWARLASLSGCRCGVSGSGR